MEYKRQVGGHLYGSKKWDASIYRTGLIADSYIWENIKYLNSRPFPSIRRGYLI